MTEAQTTTMFMFPGQGSQYVGMGSDVHAEFASARAIYERASEALGYDVAKLSFEDPEDKLHKTEFTQPALLTHSIACLEAFQEARGEREHASVFAGHSLGEYSALVASGALAFEAALALVKRRGELMGAHGRGEMIAFRLDRDTVKPIAERYYCGIGGCNLAEQTVVGGRSEDLDRVAAVVAEQFPKKPAVRLKTDGAFHTYLMVGAAEHFRPALDEATFEAPTGRVMSNYTGDFHEPEAAAIKSKLFFQLFHPVKWIWGLHTAAEAGLDAVIEFGGGIGKEDDPAAKRPNLAGVTKKALRSLGKKASYRAAINTATIRESAAG